MRTTCIAAGLALASTAALAAPQIERVDVRPNPAQFDGATPPQIEIAVTIKRGPLDVQRCEIDIDPGNPGGDLVPRMTFNMGGERTQRVRYIYRKPGSYRLTVRGRDGCSGANRTVTVNVRAASAVDSARPPSSAPAAAAKDAKPRCPSGWQLVEQSVQGPRYSCSARPPARPIKCEGGTSYFAENGLIGCR
jgi:hypothetical protein